MKTTMKSCQSAAQAIFLSAILACSAHGSEKILPGRWSTEQANTWYAAQPWLVGCNYMPSTAINSLEKWQAETFDPETIDRELGWAAAMGMNTVRVDLHDILRPDGTPFDPAEVELIKSLTADKSSE